VITISLCMIVKNEEQLLARCLHTVHSLVDEIIVVDTGSTDRTREIAAQFTERIYDFEWVDDFAAARNYAFAQATKDYILWLDADDILKEADQAKLRALKENLPPTTDSVSMLYHLSEDEYGNVTFSMRRNRLVRRSMSFRWIGAVHEYLEVFGTVISSDAAVTHRSASEDHASTRNLDIYERRLAAGETFSPRDLYYYANELKDHRQYRKASSFYERFLDGGQGWIEDNIAACGKLADCYHELGDKQRQLEATLRAFGYGSPRAEFCCRLGYRKMEEADWRAAITWYSLATELPPPADSWGFVNPTFSTWLPHLQLAVCYDRVGEHDLAERHNELALAYRPGDERMLANRRYFEGIRETAQQAKDGGESDAG
jgi:glycosyltransferase involved in cell wall biosynthesis